MGIPSHTRIIVIPDDNQPSREYGIARAWVLVFMALILVFCVFLGLLMASFARKHDERAAIAVLEQQLAEARTEVQTAHALAAELEQMRQMQEKLLLMLGVETVAPAAADSLERWLEQAPGSTAESLQRTAAVVLSQKPEIWPARGPVTQEFEAGNAARGIRPHLGVDIAGPVDAPILAAATGEVDRTGFDDYLGNFVEIRHGLGYLTVYGHCSRVAVGKGDRVATGQVVAYMGQTGQASAPHLHFEIWHQGEAVDPRGVVGGEPQRN